MPLVAPVNFTVAFFIRVCQQRVGRVGATHAGGPGLGRSGVVGDAEMQGFEPVRAGLGNGLDVGHAHGRFDQGSDRYGLETFGCFDLAQQQGNKFEFGGLANLGHQDAVELVAGLFDHIDDVVITVVRIETIDAY